MRAVAVTLVMLMHNGWAAPNGRIGVDVFFVLSGFLITSVLRSEHERTGGISLSTFYWRRFLRLTPAFALLLLVYAAYACFWSGNWRGQVLAMVYAASYVMNWNMIYEWGPTGLLTNTWSLAIEEQFYVLWAPMLLALLRYCRQRFVLAVVAALFSASALLHIELALHAPNDYRAYLGLDTRADGLLLGSLLALLGPGIVPRAAVAAWPLPAIFLGYIALSYPAEIGPFMDKGGNLLVSLAAAWLIAVIVRAPHAGPAMVLRVKPLVFVGSLSYSLYLWHWPLLAFMREVDSHRPWLATAAAFAFSLVSYFMVERPAARLKNWAPRGQQTQVQKMPTVRA